MARLNIDQEALTDFRFYDLGQLLGWDRHSALGRMAQAWSLCLHRGRYHLTESEIGFALDAPPREAVDALVAVELARIEPEGIYLCGTRGRVEWYWEKKEQLKKARQIKHSKSVDNSVHSSVDRPVINTVHRPALAPAPALPPALALDLDPPYPPQAGDGRSKPTRRDRAAETLSLYQATARELWDYQNELRRRSMPGSRALTPTSESLARVAQRLEEGFTVEDCRTVIEVYANDAHREPKTAQWFNGETNWRPENFRRALGRAGAPRTAIKPTTAQLLARADELEDRDAGKAGHATSERDAHAGLAQERLLGVRAPR